MELEVFKKIGVKFILSNENPALDNFDGVISTIHENPLPKWIKLSSKTTQPARLILEGRNLAEQMHTKLSQSENITPKNVKPFNSNYSRFTETEKKLISEQSKENKRKSECLYCDCEKKNSCKLRTYATDYEIKNIRYSKDSSFKAMQRQHIHDDLWFEQAKCVRCGLCVYNSQNGFTFKDRGYGMQIVLPEENKVNVRDGLAEICPVGALFSSSLKLKSRK